MVQRGLASSTPTEVIFDTQKKGLETRSKAEGVKITSVGLNLNRQQLQHWLLFVEHNTINRLRSKDLNVVAGLSVPVDYDCVYYSV